MDTKVHELLQKEVSRKEFLQTLGVGLASIFGLSSLIKLAGYHGHSQLSSKGYGSHPYGH